MDTILIDTGAVALVALLFVTVWMSGTRSTSLPLPPGPRGIPFLGNALDIDTAKPHLTYTQWGRQYGGIIYSRLLGQDYIIVNSEKVARTMSDTRRSVVYADRPRLSIYKLLGIDSITPTMAYGDTWRMHRKIFHQVLRSEVIVKYQSFYLSKAMLLVHDLLQDGSTSNLGIILQSFAATITLSLTYGYDIKSPDHSVVKLVQGFTDIISKEGFSEKSVLLQTFPFFKHLPSWIPGLGFIERAAACKKLARDVWDQPFEHTKREVVRELLPASHHNRWWLTSHEEDKDSDSCQHFEDTLKSTAATMYIAGSETTASTLHTVILAMVLFPEVQEKAQAQINSIVGMDRLPTFDDRDALPYIEAIIHEAMRWHPVVPLGIPHATTTDDVYEGFLIPKGATVIFNAWAMSRDCVNADQFDPERHLLPTGELSPTARMTGSYTFGFGRRVCPGRFLAESVMWTAVAHILATLHLSRVKDANGRPIEINPVFTTGVACHPEPFQFRITGNERAKLIDK